MAEYRVSGELEANAACSLPTLDTRVVVLQAVRVEPTARADGPTVDLRADDDDLLEVELENGVKLWTTAGQLLEDCEAAGLRQRGEPGFPLAYPLQRRGTERGVRGDPIRALRVIGVDLPKGAAKLAAEKVEAQLEGDGQFFRIDASGALSREDPPAAGAGEPTLVLIHGTFSSTTNGYKGLFKENNDIWRELVRRYDGRVFGFDHRTLSKGPLDNALEFLDALPAKANLHIVTHSRGGLVGDLIAHGGVRGDAFAREDLERELKRAYGSDPDLYKKQYALYQRFNARIAEVAPRVTRYVRVGCPAAGTTLAS